MSKRRALLTLFILLCGAGWTRAQQTRDRSVSPLQNFLGQWTTADGKPAFTIESNAPSEGLTLKGAYDDWYGELEGANTVVFTRTPTVDQMDPAVPDWARAKVQGFQWELRLTVKESSCAELSLEGTMDKKKIRAVEKRRSDTQEVISREATVLPGDPQSVRYIRQGSADIHITRIHVDYQNGKQRIRELQERSNDVESSLSSLNSLLAEARQRYQAALPAVQAAQKKVDALKKAIAQAQPDPNLQMQIDYLEALKYYQELSASGADGSNAEFVKTVNDKNALLKQLRAKGIPAPLSDQKTPEQLQAMIDPLEARQKAGGDKLFDLNDQLIVAGGELNKAQTPLDLAAQTMNSLNDQIAPLKEEKARLDEQLANVRKLGDPQLTEATVSGPDGQNYDAVWWDFYDALDELNGAIDKLSQAITEAQDDSNHAEDAYTKAIDDELSAGDNAARAIYKSAVAQWGVEAADFLADVLKSGGSATLKKMFDIAKDYAFMKAQNLVTGEDKGFEDMFGYSFVDEEAIRKEMAAMGNHTPDVVGVNQWKDRVVDVAKSFLLDKGTRTTLEKLLEPQAVVSSAGGKPSVTWGFGKVGQLLAYEAERHKALEEVINDLGDKAAFYSVKGGKSSIVGSTLTDVAKDYVKSKAKEGLSYWIEDDAWRQYFQAEFRRQALHTQMLGAEMRVDTLVDERDRLLDLRDELFRQYNQDDMTYYQGTEKTPLHPRKDYSAHLNFKGAPPTAVDLHISNIEAKGGPTAFNFNTGCTKGDLEMYVNVTNY